MKRFTVVLLTVCMMFCFASCKQEVTVETLVDAYLENSTDSEDHTSYVSYDLGIEYHGDLEGASEMIQTEYRHDYDADSCITYQEGTYSYCFSMPEMDEEVSSFEIKKYILDNDDGTSISMQWSEEDSAWITSESVDEESPEDRAALLGGATYVEEADRYILMVECDAADVGFDVASFVMGDSKATVTCGVTLTAVIDKGSLECTATSLVIDVEELNAIMKELDADMSLTGFVINMKEFDFEEVELAMPE